jgi:hypothetical protein
MYLKFKEWQAKDAEKRSLVDKAEQETAEVLRNYADYMAEHVSSKSHKENEELAEAVKDFKKAQKSASDAQTEILKKQGEALAKLQAGNPAQSVNKSIVDKFDKGFDKLQEAIKEKRGGEIGILKLNNAELAVLKATVTTASVTNNTDAFRISEIERFAHKQLTFYDLFPKFQVGVNANGNVKYSDWDEATTVLASAGLSEGDPFPESTATWQEYTAGIKKIGVSIQVSEESLVDRKRFTDELNWFLSTDVDLEVDTQLYDGDGSAKKLTGVFTSAIAYVPVASGIVDANIFDLIRKVRTNISKGKRSKFMGNMCAMNADDIDQMLLKKDANNNYVRPDFFQMRLGDGTNVYVVSGVLIIESNAVTTNTMLVGDSRFAQIYEEGGYEILMGMPNNNFNDDLRTLKARKRLLLLVKESNRQAFRKVTDIDAALVTLAL